VLTIFYLVPDVCISYKRFLLVPHISLEIKGSLKQSLIWLSRSKIIAIAFFLITKTTGDLQEIYASNVQVESKFYS